MGGFPLKFWKTAKFVESGVLMPCFRRDPITKGQALVAAIRAEKLPRRVDSCYAFSMGFLAGCSFICWLLLA